MIRYIYLILVNFIIGIENHGYMINPPGRSSLWRFNNKAPINYDDNGLNCGWKLIPNKYKCGICGDNILDPRPRKNEMYGKYYTGIISRKYKNVLNIKIILTSNHKGRFDFYLCNIDKYKNETISCFKKLNKKTFKVSIKKNIYEYKLSVKNYKCKHCVLQWVYTTGNNWKYKNKEIFINCADISIL